MCLANAAKAVYSLDINNPEEDFHRLRRKYENLNFIETDVTKKESVAKSIDAIFEEEGRLDGFVANAGMTKHQPALDFSEEQLHQIFELNVRVRPRTETSRLLNSRHVGVRYVSLCNQHRAKVDRERRSGFHRFHRINDLLST